LIWLFFVFQAASDACFAVRGRGVADFAALDDDVARCFGAVQMHQRPAAHGRAQRGATAEHGVFVVAVGRVRHQKRHAVCAAGNDTDVQRGSGGDAAVEEVLQLLRGHGVSLFDGV